MKQFYKILIVLNLLFMCGCYNEEINNKELENPSENKQVSIDSVPKEKNSNRKQFSGVSIEIPEELVEASEDQIKKKYPGARRPGVVYTNIDMSVNFNYSITKNKLTSNDLKEYLTRTSNALTQNFGSENITQSLMDTINGLPFAIIEFYSPGNGEDIYNLMYTTSVNDNMAIFSFNCTESKIKEWEEEISEIFDSIKFE